MSRRRRWGERWRGEATKVERVGGCCLFAPGVESKGNKNSKIKLAVALDGSRRAKHTQQPTKSRSRRWQWTWRGEATGAERVGLTPCRRLAIEMINENLNRKTYVVALGGSQTSNTTQQPTKNTRERRGMDRTGGVPTESAGGTVLDRSEGSQVGR